MMTKKFAAIAARYACVAGCMITGAAFAADAKELAKKVAADFPGHANDAVWHYVVPAMSDVQRFRDSYPEDGIPSGTVNVVVARDEYEDASFLVWPNKNLGKVQLSLSELKTDKGEVFPAADLDLRVVKVWYQNRNAWFSYFGDTGLKLVPELLLHDDELIRVDEKNVSNYAKLVDADGKKREFWLNAPRDMKARQMEVPWSHMERFEPMRGDFFDADKLQPVLLQEHAFRNFFITVHAKKDAKPGIYRGAVKLVSADKGKPLGEIPVAVKVLDFVLPQPKCWDNPDKDFLVSFYDCASLGSMLARNGYDMAKAKRQLVNIFRNQVAHNQTVHWIGKNMSNEAYLTFDAMKEAGMRMDIHFSVFGPVYGEKDPETRPQRIADELDRRIGNHNSYIGHGDEPGSKWLEQQRPVFEAFQKAGLKFIIAGGDYVFHMAGYLYDWHNVAKDPDDASSPRLWNSMKNDNHLGWYACQHVGSENPSFNRRQNGLAAYLSGYTSLCNYEFALGPWNDDSTTYRPMVYAYACGDSIVDTLQWEGFREGVDDIRYATLLSDYARKAQNSKDLATRYLGGQSMQYLAGLNRKNCDMDMVRAEMIARIERLAPLVAPYVEKTSVVNDESAAKAGAARGEKNLQNDIAAALAEMKNAKTLKETNDVHMAVAAAYKRYFRFEEAGDYLVKAGLPAAATAYEHSSGGCYSYLPEKQEAAHLAAFRANAGKGGVNGRDEAFWALLPKHPEFLASDFDDVFFHEFKPTDTNRWRSAVSSIFQRLGQKRQYMVTQDFAASTAVYEKAIAVAKKWDVTVPALTARNIFEAYVLLNKDAQAVAVAKEGLKDEKAKPEERAFLVFAERFGTNRGNDKGAVDLAKKVSEGLGEIAPADRVKAIQLLGSILYGCGREGAVRGLEEYRKSLYKPEPKKRYVVKFTDKPITGIGDMERVVAESALYDRAYGGNMEFLTTDVVTGNRGDVGSSKEKLDPPVMKVVADVQGVHILITAKDPKAKEIELGLVGDYSFEGYIAPGPNTPYYCVLAESLKRNLSVFNTTYDTVGFRRLGKDDFEGKIRFDRQYREGEVLCYFFFGWLNWPTMVPKNGTVWDYENMCWHRAGNNCWNGTESIHGRSTWGEFEFELTDAQRATVLRPLLAKVYSSYKSEKNYGPTAIGYWKDSTLGDLQFYTNSVAPLEQELDRLGGLLTVDMPDATVFWLEKEAMPRWYDIYQEVARRRSRWLTEKEMGK